ncbi:phosphoglycolate/pyridoxal phosphate family phosphatase [bacterium]|nr:phosphoglycolate/pyridoxal phosphate family phosphatase [bacterium]
MQLSNTDRLTYVFDLDGVIYRGKELQPHAIELLSVLRDRGHAVRFYTNNAARSRKSYVNRLASMGIPTPIEEIMTSSYATALYFVEMNAVGKTVYRIGEKGMAEEFEAVGMKVIYDQEEPHAKIDFVTVGIDRDFNYHKLARAQRAIHRGAKFIATNEDATFPMESGTLMPGGGCMVAAVRTATDVEPFVIGKPATYAYDKILEFTNCPPERSVMVGDRLDTDILVGNRAGAQTVLVLTGVTSREQAESATGDLKPDRIIETLEELL